MYSYSYNGSEALFAGLAAVFGIIIVISLIISVITIIGMWKVLEKGNKPGWGALIPIYNTYLVCDMVGVNPWWILIVALSPILNIIPIIGALAQLTISIYFTILLNVSLARAFKKEDIYALGLIFLAPIFYLILGFGKENNYAGKNPMRDILFDNLNENKNNGNVNEAQYTENTKYCPSCGAKMEIDTKYCPKCGKEL